MSQISRNVSTNAGRGFTKVHSELPATATVYAGVDVDGSTLFKVDVTAHDWAGMRAKCTGEACNIKVLAREHKEVAPGDVAEVVASFALVAGAALVDLIDADIRRWGELIIQATSATGNGTVFVEGICK